MSDQSFHEARERVTAFANELGDAARTSTIEIRNGMHVGIAADLRALLSHADEAGWRPIEEAPRDGTKILIAGKGVQNTGWMIDAASWRCRRHSLLSSFHQCSDANPECEMAWLVCLGTAYGVPVNHWMSLPPPPKEPTDGR